jgi:adenylate cyclase
MTASPSHTNPDVFDRRYATALNADVVDYTRHLSDDPEGTIATIEMYRETVAELVVENGGWLVDFTADSFMALFDDAHTAITAAIGICLRVKEQPGPLPLRFRMGLDTGEVVVTPEGRAFGDALNIASRIQTITDIGGINVSERVYRALDEPAFRFRPLGARHLKNVPGEVRVYGLQGLDSTEARTRDAVVPRIAVLPFPSDPGDEHIADAIRLDLVTHLVKMPGLEVVEIDDADGRHARSQATARYLLEGGLHVMGERVRFYLQLLETRTFNRLWADRWDGALDDLFELQDRIAEAAIRALEIDLVVGEPSRIYRDALEPDLVRLVYRGWSEFAKPTSAGLHRAIELFDEVSARAPNVAMPPALSAFARWYGVLSGLSDDPAGDLEGARRYASCGVELDDPSGLSQMVHAALILHDGDDLEDALLRAREALVRRPTCDVTFGVYASIERYRGNWETAVEASQRAIAMSPMIKPWYETTLAGAYFVGERYREAADTAEALVVQGDDSPEILVLLAAAQQALGLHRRAAATVASVTARHPGTRRDRLAELHPFQDQEVLDRWLRLLEEAGVP